MKQSKLIPVTYEDTKNSVRLTNYADTIVLDGDGNSGNLCAIRFGGYPEAVRGMADAVYGGGDLFAQIDGRTVQVKTLRKQYRRQVTHDGVYAEATLLFERNVNNCVSDDEEDDEDNEKPPEKSYIFCKANDPDALYTELDRVTAVPMIPQFCDYLLSELESRGILQKLAVYSSSKAFDAYALSATTNDGNIIDVVEDGVRTGAISVPGAQHGLSPLAEIGSVTDYLNTFGTELAERIKTMFVPLYDPSKEPLSPEVLQINNFIQSQTGYTLYNAQLAVAEAIKRQLGTSKVGLVVAECGTGKSKIGATALATYQKQLNRKTFNVILCPSHLTKKWVRELQETLPDTFAVVVKSITELDAVYDKYQRGTQSCYHDQFNKTNCGGKNLRRRKPSLCLQLFAQVRIVGGRLLRHGDFRLSPCGTALS